MVGCSIYCYYLGLAHRACSLTASTTDQGECHSSLSPTLTLTSLHHYIQEYTVSYGELWKSRAIREFCEVPWKPSQETTYHFTPRRQG